MIWKYQLKEMKGSKLSTPKNTNTAKYTILGGISYNIHEISKSAEMLELLGSSCNSNWYNMEMAEYDIQDTKNLLQWIS